MAISRGSMSKQITKSPGKRSSKWSSARKRRIDCKRPKGFSERAHCASKKGEVVRGEPVKVCTNVKKESFCTCWKIMKGRYYA